MEQQRLNNLQMTAIVILRIAIGWHFLYEGIAKLLKDNWSAAGFLMQSRGAFEGLFRWMANTPAVLDWVNFLNIWGLILIGIALILGGFTRLSAIVGALMVLMYYLCNPPFVGYFYSIPMEGSYLVINKNIVEVAALFLIAVTYSGRFIGVDRILHRLFSGRKEVAAPAAAGSAAV